ncbi:hypothetical protein RHCRD62_20546 [Rhodococcus sp. RD6.2]|nr:hypothetical protein RHCRD62_20546 [Rhodococcus sp. RD6.2]
MGRPRRRPVADVDGDRLVEGQADPAESAGDGRGMRRSRQPEGPRGRGDRGDPRRRGHGPRSRRDRQTLRTSRVDHHEGEPAAAGPVRHDRPGGDRPVADRMARAEFRIEPDIRPGHATRFGGQDWLLPNMSELPALPEPELPALPESELPALPEPELPASPGSELPLTTLLESKYTVSFAR